MVTQLQEVLPGRTIEKVWRDFNQGSNPLPINFEKEIAGDSFISVLRRGKYIVIYLASMRSLIFHPRMTGHFLFGKWEKEKGCWAVAGEQGGPLCDRQNSYLRMIFFLDDGNVLALSDLRRFATVNFIPSAEVESFFKEKELGKDALKITKDEFISRILSSKKPIKSTLMDQSKLAGVGNIYSDEALFKARINPLRKANSLNRDELARIYNAMQDVLKLGIDLNGESKSDYRDIYGRMGNFEQAVQVYRRENSPCPVCGGKIIARKIGGRTAHFCFNCQK